MINKRFSLLVIGMMIIIIINGCTYDVEDNADDSRKNSNDKSNVLKWAIEEVALDNSETQELIQLAADHGIIIETYIIPQHRDGEASKMLESLMNGEEIDICYNSYTNMKKDINAGVVYPLEQLAIDMGYDIKKKFGKYLPVFNGRVYGLPAYIDIGITLYNKKIFDEAGIKYPSPDNWTWEKYIETAKKLTDTSKGIYGSYMPTNWAHHNYMLAIQKGISHYKDDGTSNYDSLEFAEALKFNYDFGNEYKVQPDYLTIKSKQLSYDSFANGNYGMCVSGGWIIYLMRDKEKYPRDWEFGLLPMPYPEGYNKSTLVATGNYWIPTTSKKKELAFKLIALFAEHQYSLGYGKIPARVDLSDEELNTYIQEGLVASFQEDNITEEDFRNAWFDKDMKMYIEKVVGYGDVAINQAFVEEGALYGLKEISLEEAMDNIKQKADKAISDDMK